MTNVVKKIMQNREQKRVNKIR